MYFKKRDGELGEKMIPTRRCRSEDFEEFSTVAPSHESMLNEYKEGKRHLFCLDWDKVGDDLEL